jgi:hypothetical protein
MIAVIPLLPLHGVERDNCTFTFMFLTYINQLH